MNQFFTPVSKREELEPLYEDTGSFVLSHSPMSEAPKPIIYKSNNVYKCKAKAILLVKTAVGYEY